VFVKPIGFFLIGFFNFTIRIDPVIYWEKEDMFFGILEDIEGGIWLGNLKYMAR